MRVVVEIASADPEKWARVDETLATLIALGYATPRILAVAQARYDCTEGLRCRLLQQMN